jgi:hypothetical protein
METNQMTSVMEWGQRHAVEIVKDVIKCCANCKHIVFETAQCIHFATCKIIENVIPDQDIEGFYCSRFVAKEENNGKLENEYLSKEETNEILKQIGEIFDTPDMKEYRFYQGVNKAIKLYLENLENKKLYNEAKEEFTYLKKFKGEIINEELFYKMEELPFVIIWYNGKNSTHKGTWFSAYLVKPSYKKFFDRKPEKDEIEDEFDFYYIIGNNLMEKYLLTFEIRHPYKDKTVSLGMYDTYDDACNVGNDFLRLMESRFPLYVFPNGDTKKERFGYYDLEGYQCKHNIISNLAYLQTPFIFYAKIETINFVELSEINSIIDATLNK